MLPFTDTQSYLILGAPMDCSLPCSSVHGICQARTLKWVAISSSRGSSWPNIRTCISCISCIGRWILHHWVACEALHLSICEPEFTLSDPFNPFICVYYFSTFEDLTQIHLFCKVAHDFFNFTYVPLLFLHSILHICVLYHF